MRTPLRAKRPTNARRARFRPECEPVEPRVLMATLYVTSVSDSGVGSLRQAIIDANSDVTKDTIRFNLGGGVETIKPLTPLPAITQPAVINGFPLQFPGQVVQISGDLQGGGDGLTVMASDSDVVALVVNDFAGSGLVLRGANNGLVQSSYFGLDPSGTVARPNGTGVTIEGSANDEVYGNIISGNSGDGLLIDSTGSGVASTSTTVLLNTIGLNVISTAALGNGGDGIDLLGSSYNQILTNQISANHVGIEINNGSGNVIQGNAIGTTFSGAATTFGNSLQGMFLGGGATSTTIGGASAGQGNLIEDNLGSGLDFKSDNPMDPVQGAPVQGNTIKGNSQGISIRASAAGVQVIGNSIFANSISSIMLSGNGNSSPTAPILTSATILGGDLNVRGTIAPGASPYLIQLYASAGNAADGDGTGQTLLGSTVVTSNGSSPQAFSAILPGLLKAGQFVSATATSLGTQGTSIFTPSLAATTLELGFGIGLDGQLYYEKFDASGNLVANFALVAPGMITTFTSGHDGQGLPVVFATGLDGQIYTVKFNSAGTPVGGYTLTTPGLARQANVGYDKFGNPQLFVVGGDNQIYTERFDSTADSISAYALVAGGVIQAPSLAADPSESQRTFSVGRDGSGNPLLFVTGLDGRIYEAKVDLPNSSSRGYTLAAQGVVQSEKIGYDAQGNVELFVLGMDSQIYTATFDSQGNPTSGYVLTAPGQVKSFSLGRSGAGNPLVFAIGLDSRAYSLNIATSGVSSINYAMISNLFAQGPDAGFTSGNNSQLFIRGANNAVYSVVFNSNGFPVSDFVFAGVPVSLFRVSNSFASN